MIENISLAYKTAKRNYDRGTHALTDCFAVAAQCLDLVEKNAKFRNFGIAAQDTAAVYLVAETETAISRPIRHDQLISDSDVFMKMSLEVLKRLEEGILSNSFDAVIYTAVSAFSISYDLWAPKSRKTPGTFFEVLIGSAARVFFRNCQLSKHIPIVNLPVSEVTDALASNSVEGGEGDDFLGNSVSTDLVITNPSSTKSAVIPLKITTRERIVQPFAHQRILDSAYPGRYCSFVACISEVQRDDRTQTVRQICVPGTIALFQKHLARLNGLYYCDIPVRYAQPDFQEVIPVKPFYTLFKDVADYLAC